MIFDCNTYYVVVLLIIIVYLTYRRHHEHIYPSWVGGCPERDGPPGGTESGQGRSSESRRREEAVDAEKLQSSLIWKNERPADRDGQQGAFDDVMTDKGDTYIDCYSHLFLLVVK